MTRDNGIRFVRFLAVGVLNTAFGLGLYWLLLALGLGPQPALALSFAIGVLWNFRTHARLVFDTKGYGRFLPYAGAYGVIYVVNALSLRFLLINGTDKYLAQAILVLPMAVLAFILISKVLTARAPLSATERD